MSRPDPSRMNDQEREVFLGAEQKARDLLSAWKAEQEAHRGYLRALYEFKQSLGVADEWDACPEFPICVEGHVILRERGTQEIIIVPCHVIPARPAEPGGDHQ